MVNQYQERMNRVSDEKDQLFIATASIYIEENITKINSPTLPHLGIPILLAATKRM